MRSFIAHITSEEGEFLLAVFLTMAAIFVIACVIDYIRWRRKK